MIYLGPQNQNKKNIEPKEGKKEPRIRGEGSGQMASNVLNGFMDTLDRFRIDIRAETICMGNRAHTIFHRNPWNVCREKGFGFADGNVFHYFSAIGCDQRYI